VKAISCSSMLADLMRRDKLSASVGQVNTRSLRAIRLHCCCLASALNLLCCCPQIAGELLTCNLLLSHGLKGEQTLEQSIIIGDEGELHNNSSDGSEGRSFHLSCLSSGDLKAQAYMNAAFTNQAFNQIKAENKKDFPRLTLQQLTDKNSETENMTAMNKGRAKLITTMNHPYWKQPHNGITEFKMDRSVDWNVANYVRNSSQRMITMSTAVGVHQYPVYGSLNSNSVICAGILVEILPQSPLKEFYHSIVEDGNNIFDKDNDDIFDAEYALMRKRASILIKLDFKGFLNTLGESLRDGMPQERILCNLIRLALSTPSSEKLNATKQIPSFHCTCSIAKVTQSLASLSPEEQHDVMSSTAREKDGSHIFSVTCQFCGKLYQIPAKGI
jgi:redox-regulated HSP33 family molecular chaperone